MYEGSRFPATWQLLCSPGEFLGQQGTTWPAVTGWLFSVCPCPRCPGAEARQVTGLKRKGGKRCERKKPRAPSSPSLANMKRRQEREKRWSRCAEFSTSLCSWKLLGAKEGFVLFFVNNRDHCLQNSHEKERGEFFVR